MPPSFAPSFAKFSPRRRVGGDDTATRKPSDFSEPHVVGVGVFGAKGGTHASVRGRRGEDLAIVHGKLRLLLRVRVHQGRSSALSIILGARDTMFRSI